MKTPKFRTLLLLGWVGFLLLQSFPAPAGSALGKDTITSVAEPFGTCHAGYSRAYPEYQLLGSMGNQWMRIDFTWANIEPVHGQWDFSYYDAYLATAANYSQRVMAILDYDVEWLNTTGAYQEVRPYIKPEYIPYFLDCVNLS